MVSVHADGSCRIRYYEVEMKLKIPALNIEHFGVEKYEELLERFDKKVKTCTQHTSRFIVHCSLYEVLLFAARVCEKIGEIEKKK